MKKMQSCKIVTKGFCLALFFCQAFMGNAAANTPVRLSLKECVELALRSNTQLQIQRVDEEESQALFLATSDLYFPQLTLDVGFHQDRFATPFAYADSSGIYDQSSFMYQSQLAGLLPIPLGTRYELGLAANMTWTDQQSALLSPQHLNSIHLELEQPLLKGWGKNETSSRIEISQWENRATRQEVRQRISTILLEVAKAYWQLVAQQRTLAVAQLSLSLTQKQFSLAQTRHRAGLLSALDLSETEAEVALQTQAVQEEQIKLIKAEHDLLLFIHTVHYLKKASHPQKASHETRQLLTENIQATDDFNDDKERRSLDVLLERALAEHPEIKAATMWLRSAKIASARAGNAVLPALDLKATVGATSLAGQAACLPNDPRCAALNPDLLGNHGAAWSQVFSFKLPFWQVGVSFAMPLGNDQRTLERRQRALDEKRRRLTLENLRSQIAIEVREIHQRLQANRRVLASSVKRLDLSKKNLAIAEKKFSHGLCSAYDLIRFRMARTSAEQEQILAQKRQAVSRLELEAAIGDLPSYLGVRLR